MTMSFSFGCEGNDKEGDRMWLRNYEDKQGLCDQVASGGSRCIGSECNLLGSVLHDGRRGRMILLM